MANIALLTAAGSGTRMHQDIPKQFLHVNNKPIIVYTMEAFQRHPSIDEILVVCLDGWYDILGAYAKQFGITKLKYIVSGGKTGQASIYNGLVKLKETHDDDDIVMIHDGNRPMVSQEIISDSFSKFRKFGDAVAVIPCVEVVFTSKDGINGIDTISRDELFRTQTPHTYKLGDIMSAHYEAMKKGITNTAASCNLMHELGREVHFSKGEEKNLKITTTDDLEIFKALLNSERTDWLK